MRVKSKIVAGSLEVMTMKNKLFQNKLVVKKSLMHGYGVFAGKTIKKGEMIEECYILVSKKENAGLIDFYFDANGKYVILTGFGSIYNHLDEPNADYKINLKKKIATIKAEKKILKGEEIFVSYGQEWFDSRGLKPINIVKKLKKTRSFNKKNR